MEWKPIESAPKDGTPLLLWDTSAENYASGDEDLARPVRAPFVGWWQGNGWHLFHYDAFIYEPTHWMPLPSPPGGSE